MQLNNELMILTRMESWGVNALVTSQLHLMANQTAMELQKTHSELFIFENKASSSCIYSALMSTWTCSESLMVCVLIIKRLIWYLFMFVFFWCWLFVVIVRVVSVAISGSLLTPWVPVWCLCYKVTNCPHQQTSSGYKSGSGLLSV